MGKFALLRYLPERVSTTTNEFRRFDYCYWKPEVELLEVLLGSTGHLQARGVVLRVVVLWCCSCRVFVCVTVSLLSILVLYNAATLCGRILGRPQLQLVYCWPLQDIRL